jgi:hypothetical protein
MLAFFFIICYTLFISIELFIVSALKAEYP